jgi:hypothetical protein
VQSKANPSLSQSARRAGLTAALLLLIPAAAMLLTGEVNWGPGDFLVAGALLFGAALAWRLTVARTGELAYRLGMAIAILALLLLVWGNLAVGVIGAEGNPANLLYFAVPAAAFMVAAITGFRARGMVLAMLTAGLAQALVTLTAFATGWGDSRVEPLEVVLVNGFFTALFGAAAGMFLRSAREKHMKSNEADAEKVS